MIGVYVFLDVGEPNRNPEARRAFFPRTLPFLEHIVYEVIPAES
jgi:hypothetical protein